MREMTLSRWLESIRGIAPLPRQIEHYDLHQPNRRIPSKCYLMINSLIWNIRGLSKPSHFRRLRKIILQNHIQLLVVCETRANIMLAEVFR